MGVRDEYSVESIISYTIGFDPNTGGEPVIEARTASGSARYDVLANDRIYIENLAGNTIEGINVREKDGNLLVKINNLPNKSRPDKCYVYPAEI